jgi:type III secretory pathway component EscS
MAYENPHRGITMHQLPVAGDFPGLIFAVGSALIFLFAIPALWYVLVAAVVIGLVIAALLQVVHQRHPDETARLSLKI